MAEYTKSFEEAVNHAMLYEVGGFWNLDTPGVREGLISTTAQKRACGYVNDPVDPGGETKYGVAKNPNPDLDITTLDWAGAERIYFRRYWLAAHCDELTVFAPRLAVLHFDGAVNHGVGRAAVFLQKAVEVDPDGDIGPNTIAHAKAMDEVAACNRVCDLREAFYRSIVANKPTQAKYLNGWLRRINEMRTFTTDPAKSFA
jgi:lysozyme family protein